MNPRDCWATPERFFAGLNRRFRFEIDVCASSDNAKCSFFTESEDGLSRPWAPHRCWCNPPYSDIGPWAKKSYQEALHGSLVAMLVPPRTDSLWWHQYALRADLLLWVQGRIRFVPPPGVKESQPREPSVVVVWQHCAGMPRIETIDSVTGETVESKPASATA